MTLLQLLFIKLYVPSTVIKNIYTLSYLSHWTGYQYYLSVYMSKQAQNRWKTYPETVDKWQCWVSNLGVSILSAEWPWKLGFINQIKLWEKSKSQLATIGNICKSGMTLRGRKFIKIFQDSIKFKNFKSCPE